MADEKNPVQEPSADAPFALSGGGSSLAPTTKLAPRQVKGNQIAGYEIDPKDIVSVTPTGPDVSTSARVRETVGPSSFGYIGQNLVNNQGIISRGQYNVDEEAYNELVELGSFAERKAVLESLRQRGLYGSGKVSATGLDSGDISAMKELLRFANSQGVTVDVALNQVLTQFSPSGSGRAIRTTAKQDIRKVFRDSVRTMLGRDVSDAEVNRFVKAYEGMEITEAKGGVKAPTLASAAEAQVEQQYGAEAGAVGMLSLFDILDQKIKGLA